MKVKIRQLIDVKDQNPQFSCRVLGDISAKGRKYRYNQELYKDDLIFLDKAGQKEVDILYDEIVYSYLSTTFPVEYRIPYSSMGFYDIDRHLEELDNINGYTKRKRFLYHIGDIYTDDPASLKPARVITHNEPIDYKKWNQVKRNISKNKKIFFRNSENGIIVFVNLQPEADNNFVGRFKKNTDLVTTLVSRKRDSNIEIAPDFIPTEDVISVTNPEDLLTVYEKTCARLIIIGETLNDDYKRSLLKVREYDKFARMMVVPSVDLHNMDHLLMQIKMVYNSDRWAE